ncbi:hypothetical protein X797_010739 [Metarhizium robertsii]|uniref:Uncharacterized protein n=2 Tax=Metarhizium robertsii TaxID=568076 RepID=E9FE76_METRA|nr:uncharacterized protein MAA_10575 [Metarhizium robertsii ARSEF 23]EFY93964.1 hypothetical protein MAA_10575 [Metarhizium robertsii ARSEF 23]EXU96119.1 hypothetical protein X797_010739 [Metarhizium robertsii]
MRIYTAIAIGAVMMRTASAKCKIGNAECEWFGKSTECGGTEHKIGDWDEEGRQLTYWTRRLSIGALFEKYPGLGQECYNDYGLGCVGGYKRLWCREDMVSLQPLKLA